MMCHSIALRNYIFVKAMDFCLLLKMIKRNGKNIIKNVSSKYSPVMLTVHQKLP